MKAQGHDSIIYMGTPSFSADLLESLIPRFNIAAVVSQPDRPRGRGLELCHTPVKATALKYGMMVLQPEKTNDPQLYERIKALQPALIVVFAYGAFLTKELLRIPTLGCINLHSSLLPKYRGAAPVQWALMKGEEVTGWTTFFIDEGMDSGDIIDRFEMLIDPEEDAVNLFKRMLPAGREIIIQSIVKVLEGKAPRMPQEHTQASFARSLKKIDGLISWRDPSQEIVNQVRGLVPWPAAHTYIQIKGKRLELKIFKARSLSQGESCPGQILEILGHGLIVGTGSGVLLIEEVQLEGGKRMKTQDFLRGHPLTLRMILGE